MPALLHLIGQVGHYGALLPLLACLALPGRRERSPETWLLAAAFGISFVADQAGDRLAEAGVNNWWISYLYAPVQFGLLAAIVTRPGPVRWLTVGGILLLGALSAWRGPLEVPETIVQVYGGLLVGWLALGSPLIDRERPAFRLYTIDAVPFLIGIGVLPLGEPAWLVAWAGYQLVRLAAFALFVRGLFAPSPFRLEVEDGSGSRKDAGRDRRAVRTAGADRRAAVAPAER